MAQEVRIEGANDLSARHCQAITFDGPLVVSLMALNEDCRLKSRRIAFYKI